MKLAYVIVLFFVVLLFSLCPTIHWLDSTELVLQGASLGIGHPQGQAPFAVFGRLFQFLPFGDVAFRTSILSLVAGLGVIAILSTLIKQIVGANHPFDRIIATSCIVVLAFSGLFATQIIRPEVYALAALLTLGSIYFALSKDDTRNYFAGCFLFGMALACHSFVSFGALPFLARRKHIGKAALFSILGTLSFVYLPLRAIAGARWNFGNPAQFESFLWFLRGELYQTYQSPLAADYVNNFSEVSYMLFRALTPPLYLAGWLGLGLLGYKRYPGAFKYIAAFGIGILGLVVRTQIWTSNPDLGGYLSLTLVFIVFAGVYALTSLASRGKRLAAALSVGCLILAAYQTTFFWKETALSGDYSPHRQLRYLLAEPVGRSRVETASFHTFSFLRYGQVVEGMRPDLMVTYRGLPTSRQQTPKVEITNDYPTYWEPILTSKGNGMMTLPQSDRIRADGSESSGWFFRENTKPQVESSKILRERTQSILTEMSSSAPYGAEPLTLAYMLHILVARSRGNAALAEQYMEDTLALFPGISGLEYLDLFQ